MWYYKSKHYITSCKSNNNTVLIVIRLGFSVYSCNFKHGNKVVYIDCWTLFTNWQRVCVCFIIICNIKSRLVRYHIIRLIVFWCRFIFPYRYHISPEIRLRISLLDEHAIGSISIVFWFFNDRIKKKTGNSETGIVRFLTGTHVRRIRCAEFCKRRRRKKKKIYRPNTRPRVPIIIIVERDGLGLATFWNGIPRKTVDPPPPTE